VKSLGRWFLAVLARLADLVLKLISAKTVAAIVVTWLYRASGATDPWSFGLVVVMWIVVVGVRAYEKALDAVRPRPSFSAPPKEDP